MPTALTVPAHPDAELMTDACHERLQVLHTKLAYRKARQAESEQNWDRATPR